MSRIKKYIIEGEEVAHDGLRITKFADLYDFLNEIAAVPNEVAIDIFKFLADNKHEYFQLAGDGDGLGFILDVWDNPELDNDPVDSMQIWLDEYKPELS